MTDKEKRCLEEIERCRTNIEREKQFVETHRELLKAAEKKETDLLAKLEAIKLEDLKSLISKRGYNIDDLREAMVVGDFSGVIPQKAEKDETENPAPDVSSQQEDTQSDGNTKPSDNNKSADTDDKIQQSETDKKF